MKKLKWLIPGFFLFLTGCWLFDIDRDYDFEFDTIISDYPENLEGINSSWDDFNSALPYEYLGEAIYFSSKNPTYGENFDITRKSMEITFHPRKDNILNVSYPAYNYSDTYEKKRLTLINTSANEYGPYLIGYFEGLNFLFYANDEGGDLDIKFVYNPVDDYYGDHFTGPIEATALNSESDDAYFTLNSDTTGVLFCSNRENDQFDIYSMPLISSLLLKDQFGAGAPAITKETALSGSSNDKCPFVNRNLLVFASDREGGYGGFDLWYSRLIDGEWSAPVNFGERINSEYDEYRPVTLWFYCMKEEAMIFSSNRPGGKGGYDLYFVNIGDLMVNDRWLND